jgi:hypothetical protein
MQRRGSTSVVYSLERFTHLLVVFILDSLSLLYVKAHDTNVGNNAVDELARQAAGSIPNIPSECDWDAKRLKLSRQPAPKVAGAPVIASVYISLVYCAQVLTNLCLGPIDCRQRGSLNPQPNQLARRLWLPTAYPYHEGCTCACNAKSDTGRPTQL